MSRIGGVLKWLLGIVALLVVALAVFLATFDWNLLKPPSTSGCPTPSAGRSPFRATSTCAGSATARRPAGAAGSRIRP